MCRLLCVQGQKPFEIAPHLQALADVAQTSKEYQGHGWGCAWLQDGRWRFYRNVQPMWQDEARDFGRTNLLLAHARSAFRDEGIVVENNMPFSSDGHVFIFNGELRGVRIKGQGRIGAEKIFNYVRRFDNGDIAEALRRGVSVIDKRTRYIRAMNIIMANATTVCVSSLYNEDPAYFQLHEKHSDGLRIVCSQSYAGESDWTLIDNRTTFSFRN